MDGTKLWILRDLIRRVHLTKKNLIMPIILTEVDHQISYGYFASIPLNSLIKEIQEMLNLGISQIMIFGIPKARDMFGSDAWSPRGIVQQGLRKIRGNFGKKIQVFTDVCVCQYNVSGQCGTMDQFGSDVDNEASLLTMKRIALSHAEFGTDVVALSSMMDGQVSVVKNCLVESGFNRVKIMSFAAKSSSSFYSPFRAAAFSNLHLNRKINKSKYQISYSNFRESLAEIKLDLDEGADIIMIKPSMGSADLIVEARQRFNCRLAVQNVSGEYFMMKTASENGMIDEDAWMVGYAITMKRAGAELIMSYNLDKLLEYL